MQQDPTQLPAIAAHPRPVDELIRPDPFTREENRFGFPGNVSSISIPMSTSASAPGYRLQVGRPTLLLPIAGANNAETFYDITFSPANPSSQTTPPSLYNPSESVGIQSQRGVCYLWAPGIWYVNIWSDADGQVTFAQLPCPDRLIAEYFTTPRSPGYWGDGVENVTLAAATNTVILAPFEQIGLDTLTVENTGVNAALLNWGSIATATIGLVLPAGSSRQFSGYSFPLSQLNARSTLGTTLCFGGSTRSYNRFWGP